jgi:hypothetical protein
MTTNNLTTAQLQALVAQLQAEKAALEAAKAAKGKQARVVKYTTKAGKTGLYVEAPALRLFFKADTNDAAAILKSCLVELDRALDGEFDLVKQAKTTDAE